LLTPFGTSTGNEVASFIASVLAEDSLVHVDAACDCLHTKDEATMWTPLQCVVQQANFNGGLKTTFNAKTVMKVIAKGADVNKGNTITNITPLHLAVKYANFITVKILLDAGADPTVRDNIGRNCLVNATERANLAVIKLLTSAPYNLDPNERQEVFQLDGSKRNQQFVNMPEKMLSGDDNQLTSWRIVAPPPLMDYLNMFECVSERAKRRVY